MWQLCSSIPSTLPEPKAVSLMTAKVGVASRTLRSHDHPPTSWLTEPLSLQLSTSFVLETFIHSKEKVNPPSPLVEPGCVAQP